MTLDRCRGDINYGYRANVSPITEANRVTINSTESQIRRAQTKKSILQVRCQLETYLFN